MEPAALYSYPSGGGLMVNLEFEIMIISGGGIEKGGKIQIIDLVSSNL